MEIITMNKNIIKTGTLLLAALSFTLVACNRILDEVDPVTADNGTGEVTEVLTLLNEPQTKATLSDDVSPVKAWEDGDVIAVWAGTNASTGFFQECSVADNTVSVNLYGGSYKRFNYAVYPYKYSVEGSGIPSYNVGTGVLSLNLPDTYDYTSVGGTKNPVPMVAKNLWSDGETLTFYTVGALARISVAAIPSRANKLVVSFDKTVTGNFTVQNLASLGDGNAPYIAIDAESAPSTVTVNLTPGANYINAAVNIPIPQGTINVISVAVYEDDTLLFIQGDNEHKVITNWSAARAHGKKGSVEYPRTIASLYFSPGNLYTDNDKNLLMSSNWYEHMYVYSGAVDSDHDGYAEEATISINSFETEEHYSIANRTHFNWNEMYYLMNGVKPNWTKSQDNTLDGIAVDSETGYPMSRGDFGDGFTWRVPVSTEFDQLAANTSRPGAKIEGYNGVQIRLLVTDMAPYKGLNTYNSEEDTFGSQGKYGMDPKTDYQIGVLILPDNVEIATTGETFTVFDASSLIVGTVFNLTKITREHLNDLIAQGCAFFPGIGHWTPWGPPYRFNGLGTQGNFWANTQGLNAGSSPVIDDYRDGAYVWGFTRTNTNTDAGTTFKSDFVHIRLVRDIN